MPGLIKRNGLFDGLLTEGILRDGLIESGVTLPAITNTVAPVASGTAYNGQTLSTTNGTYNLTPDSYTYQWYNGASPIGGATSSTYVVDSANEGGSITCKVTAIKAGYTSVTTDSNAIHNWIPSDITTAAHYDASDASTITETAGAVSQWDDKSGNANHAAQGTGANQPTTGTRTIGGVNAIDFDGSTDYLDLVSDINMIDKTVIAVLRVDAIGSDQQLLSNSVGTENQQVRIGTTGTLEFAAVTNPWLNDAAGQITSTGTISAATDYILEWDGDNPAAWWINGTQDANTDTRETSTAFNIGWIGARSTGSGPANYLNGIIGELILLDNPTLANRQKLEGYLAHKWGLESSLPGGHPYKTNPPTV